MTNLLIFSSNIFKTFPPSLSNSSHASLSSHIHGLLFFILFYTHAHTRMHTLKHALTHTRIFMLIHRVCCPFTVSHEYMCLGLTACDWINYQDVFPRKDWFFFSLQSLIVWGYSSRHGTLWHCLYSCWHVKLENKLMVLEAEKQNSMKLASGRSHTTETTACELCF